MSATVWYNIIKTCHEVKKTIEMMIKNAAKTWLLPYAHNRIKMKMPGFNTKISSCINSFDFKISA